ncbi:hypothetical protein FQR65_LT15681 [Abscondita terminalis]|nr:hypothetical protein FQR65_LT15681 [Abscondita terminalis]
MEPKIRFKGGGSFVHQPPQFSADSQTLYVAWKNMIVSYNVRTGKRLKTFRGLRDFVVDFSVHYIQFKNFEVLTACSVTGEMILWKVDIGVRFLKLYVPVSNARIKTFKFVDEVDGGNCRFLLSWSEGNSVYFGLLSTEEKKLRRFNLVLKKKLKCCVAFSNMFENPYMVVTQSNTLYFVRLLDCDRFYKCSVNDNKNFTCVACHPNEEGIITGNTVGQIYLWYNLTHKDPVRTVFHWHTLPVKTLSFTMTGSEFYSGADECVLVKWQVNNSHQKNFLPRLPSSIEQIAISGENQFMAVSTGDNGITILDSSMNIVSVIQHLVFSTTYAGGVVFDYRTKSLVLNGLIGHVQFYSPHDMSLLYNVNVVGQNQLTNERDYNIENTNVTKFAIDSQGLWLATVEERHDDKYASEVRLKFWEFNSVKQLFQLNTSIELPHKSVTDILFQPMDSKDLKCVTVGGDKKFKIWQLENADTIYKKATAWNCVRVGFYRNLSCRALSFSSDGSLIGVGFGPVLTTWLPDTCELKCSLVHSKNRETVNSLQFGISNQCHLVVTVTQNHLSVWNLLTLCMTWTVSVQVSLLVPNSLAAHMAAFTKDKKLFVFYPEQSKPVFTENLVDDVVGGVFIPNYMNSAAQTHWHQQSQLVFFTKKQELYCLDVDTDETEIVDLFVDSLGTSMFSNLQPQIKSGGTNRPKPVVHRTELVNKNHHLKKLLESPVHTMMPMHLLCESLLRTFVKELKVTEPSND